MSTSATEDRLHVERAQAGHYDAFEWLVGKYEGRVYATAARIVRHTQDAEEVVQQTFLSVIENLTNFRGDSSFYTWLMRITTNNALALLRRRSTRQAFPLAEDASSESYQDLPHPQFIATWSETPEEIAQRNETQQILHDALEELEEKYRVVFVLRDVEGLSTKETAEALDITPSNVKVRLLRARLMLRERMTSRFGDESTRVAPHDHEHDH